MTGDKTAAMQLQRLRPTVCHPVAVQVDGSTQRGEADLLAKQGVKHKNTKAVHGAALKALDLIQ